MSRSSSQHPVAAGRQPTAFSSDILPSSEVPQTSSYLGSDHGSTYESSLYTHDTRGRSPSPSESVVTTNTASMSRTTRTGSTPGRRRRATGTPSIMGASETHTLVCALSEARGVSPSVGIALVNVTLGVVTLSQVCDNQFYLKTINKLQVASPSTIVFVSTVAQPGNESVLYSLVNEHLEESQLHSFDRSAWSEIDGLQYIEDLAFESDLAPIKVALGGKYYAIASFAAAMRFIERQYSISVAKHSLRITYQPAEATMMIDISAIQSLEIMQNGHNPKSKSSLFGLLNHTLTPMGSRLLRASILQPSTELDDIITHRHDALEELTCNEEMFRDIRTALKAFHDVERILTKIILIPNHADVAFVEEQINRILMIKGFLEAVPELQRALAPARSSLLSKIRETCRPEIVRPILAEIRKTIESDVTYMKSALDLRNQRTFAVKAGISGMLDVARQTYKELTEEVHLLVDELIKNHNLSIVLKYDNSRKYWLQIRVADCEQGLPQAFINCIRKKDKYECQTLDLVKLNVRMSDTSNEVVIRSDNVVRNLVAELRRNAQSLFRLCDAVALMDMIASFGQVATTRDYVKPEFTSTLALKSARHPILDQPGETQFVPNDYYSTEQHAFHIVTGCNMSGKSTYIRALPLLQIMAQVGSFVPAEYAAFSIIHNIFARVSTDDNIEANLSTFSVEMREMAFILRSIDDKSIAIIDELGRGTSSRDGLAIAIAMSEALIQTKASVYFATHFIDLARVLSGRPGVLNLHLATTCSTTTEGLPQMVMLYKATGGNVDASQDYGINLAKAIGFPQTFIARAEEVARDLGERREANRAGSDTQRVNARRKLVLNLHEALKQAYEYGSADTLPGYLRRLQEEFILRMEDIGGL